MDSTLFACAAERTGKGRSLLSFPDDYVVVDIETTGFSPRYDEIIEICADRFVNGQRADRFISLVKPADPVPAYIQQLTGITDEMVADADPIEIVLPGFLAFVGDLPVVGHNVNFDVNFIYDRSLEKLGMVFSNDFSDTMRLARRLIPGMENYRLATLAGALGLNKSAMHRAGVDCDVTDAVYKHCRAAAIEQYGSVEAFQDAMVTARGNRRRIRERWKAKDITTGTEAFDTSHPLYGQVCVFTGKLDCLLRKDAMQAVVDVGGICGDRVTKETNILVLGDLSYAASIKGGKSSKQLKAEKMILDGADLQIISESAFLDLLAYGEE